MSLPAGLLRLIQQKQDLLRDWPKAKTVAREEVSKREAHLQPPASVGEKKSS